MLVWVKMFSLNLLYSSFSADELLAKLKPLKTSSSAAVVIRWEYAACPRFVEYALLQAFKSFESGKASAKSLELEWLCKLALTTNVANALQKTKPQGKCIALATVNLPLSTEELCKLGAPCCKSPALLNVGGKFLKTQYEITDAALATYSLEEMLIETAAVENI